MSDVDESSLPTWLRRHADALAIALVVLALLRVGSILTTFSFTSDEPVHVASGVELLVQKRYLIQVENPPLPRLILTLPLVLRGVDVDQNIPIERYQGMLLYAGGYRTNLLLVRAGNLLFLLLALLATWRWARLEIGPEGAALATFFLSLQPVILGYSGIANHDIAATAGLAVSLLAFSRWFDRPAFSRAVVAGLAWGVSIGLKFSLIALVPAACGAAYVCRVIYHRHERRSSGTLLKHLPVVGLAAAIGLWATYGFTFGSLREWGLETTNGGPIAASIFGADTTLPAPHLVVGILGIYAFERIAFWSYALGQWTTTGWWWYFPLALAVKSTIASLVLPLWGFCATRRDRLTRRGWTVAAASAIAIILIVLPSRLNLGIRYILPVYVPLSLAAASGALAMVGGGRRSARIAAVTLMAWHGAASIAAHPDYFPYFNEVVRTNPGRILIDSNLDWGQDVLRLASVVKRKGIDHLGIALVGMHDFNYLGFPPTYTVNPSTPARGWIAVGEHVYWTGEREGGWRWLHDHSYERVGTSIRLYWLP